MESGADVGLCFDGVPALRGGKLPFLVSSMESYDRVDVKLAPLVDLKHPTHFFTCCMEAPRF